MKPIEHEAFVSLYQKDQSIFDKLFKDVKSVTKLTSNIKSLSKSFVSLGYKDAEKVKGDLFEIFAECFFKILPMGSTKSGGYGIYGYKPEVSSNDNGVDGFGVGMDEKPMTIQVKFRSNPNEELLQDDLQQFALQSIVNYGVDKDTTTNMVVFTNAKGLHWYTESKVFSGRVSALGKDDISRLVDNNTIFWKLLIDLVLFTITKRFENEG